MKVTLLSWCDSVVINLEIFMEKLPTVGKPYPFVVFMTLASVLEQWEIIRGWSTGRFVLCNLRLWIQWISEYLDPDIK